MHVFAVGAFNDGRHKKANKGAAANRLGRGLVLLIIHRSRSAALCVQPTIHTAWLVGFIAASAGVAMIRGVRAAFVSAFSAQNHVSVSDGPTEAAFISFNQTGSAPTRLNNAAGGNGS